MGIYNALFTGASGLTAFGEGVRVIGDNIANVNTLGFKTQNVSFSDVLGQTVNVTRSNIANQVGNGVRIGAITRDQSQGSVQSTTNATDMAINGTGLFVLKDPASGQLQYTRAGSFFLDKANNLINGQGLEVQGWALDTSGSAVGSVTSVTVSNLAATAQATANARIGISLDATAPTFDPNVTMFNPADQTTFNYKSDVTVYDALGTKHNVSLYFVHVGNDSGGNAVWDWHASVDGGEVTGGTAGTPIQIGANIFNVANATLSGTSLPANTVVAGGTKLDKTVTIAIGALKDGAGNANTKAITWTAGQTLQQAIAGTANETLSSTANPYHLASAVTITSGTKVAAGEIDTSPSVVSGGTVSTTGAQSLVFNPANGALVTEKSPGIAFPWSNSSPGSISFNFGSATTTDAQGNPGTGTDGTVQLAGAFATRFMTTDGFSSGFLDHLETDSTGRISGVFTNGQRRPLFQVALAKFPNEAVLRKLGNNMLGETLASGTPVLEKPGNAGMGTISPFALEQSNVDLANEFVKLIVIQRGYEANSKTILTTDQMLSALMTLKR